MPHTRGTLSTHCAFAQHSLCSFRNVSRLSLRCFSQNWPDSLLVCLRTGHAKSCHEMRFLGWDSWLRNIQMEILRSQAEITGEDQCKSTCFIRVLPTSLTSSGLEHAAAAIYLRIYNYIYHGWEQIVITEAARTNFLPSVCWEIQVSPHWVISTWKLRSNIKSYRSHAAIEHKWVCGLRVLTSSNFNETINIVAVVSQWSYIHNHVGTLHHNLTAPTIELLIHKA